MTISKSLSKTTSAIVFVGIASSLMLAPIAQAEEKSGTGQAVAVAGSSLATYVSAWAALDEFLDTQEFTAQDRKFFLESQSFAHKSWKKSTSTVSEALNDIRTGKIGAIRVQVAGMKADDAYKLMLEQQTNAALQIRNEIHLPTATRNSIEMILEVYNEPIPPNVRDGIIEQAIKNQTLEARYASKVAEYIDHMSDASLLYHHRNGMVKFSEAVLDRKAILTSDTMMVFTRTEAETPEMVLRLIDKRRIESVETIGSYEYRRVLWNLTRAREIAPSTKEFRANKKFAAFGLGLTALIFGGFTIYELVDLFQTPASKWTPQQIDVKK